MKGCLRILRLAVHVILRYFGAVNSRCRIFLIHIRTKASRESKSRSYIFQAERRHVASTALYRARLRPAQPTENAFQHHFKMKNLAKLFGALAYALFTFERFADRNEPIRSKGRYVRA